MRQEQSIISLYPIPVQGRALRRWYLLPTWLAQFTNSEVRDIHLFPLFYDLILLCLLCGFFDIFLPAYSALSAVERGWELTISDHLVWSFAWQRRIYVFALLYPEALAPTLLYRWSDQRQLPVHSGRCTYHLVYISLGYVRYVMGELAVTDKVEISRDTIT